MQTGHQPDIENIEAIIARLSNGHRSPRCTQGEKLAMHNREFAAISQMNLKWRERLGIVIFPQCFDCHAASYTIDNCAWQSAACSSALV